eukprot:scaffold169678_cov47-Attheya_sp.AAC.1
MEMALSFRTASERASFSSGNCTDPSAKERHRPSLSLFIVDLERSQEQQDQDGHILQQVSLGQTTGEVYVGVPVVGRGYLNMPEKTAEVFVQDPSCPRLYRMGDLGRLLPSGQLEILGRCDFMVKIRGYSVVLGAIETALAKHPKTIEQRRAHRWSQRESGWQKIGGLCRSYPMV